MQVHSSAYDLEAKSWSVPSFPAGDSPRTLVLAFGAPEVLAEPQAMTELARAYPRSIVVGCSSAGEIHGTTIRDKSLSVTVTKLDRTDIVLTSIDVAGPADSFATGQALAKKLSVKSGLRAVMLLSEGLNVNGSELVRGVNSVLDESIVVTGGLSGDGTRFKQTWVAIGGNLKSNVVAAVGFYGDYVQIGHGSKGGWDKFGPERVVTKSEGNVLYELDGKPALQLYKEYLGDKAKDLPSSGLLFPLALRSSNKDDKVLVRTLLAVDHEKNSLTFAGDIPKGYLAQLMKADFDRLIGGASLASAMAKDTGAPLGKDSLVVAISCVGRRLVLGDRTEEEVEAVLEALPKEQKAHITGFYSYGEISPYASGHCDLHNQTMTLTVFTESPTPLPKRAAKRAVEQEDEKTARDLSVEARRAASASRDADLDWGSAPKVATPAGFRVDSFAFDLANNAWSVAAFPDTDSERTLVLAFGAPEVLGAPDCMARLAKAYPRSLVVGCSSAGEIHGTQVKDNSISVTVARFAKTDLQLARADVAGPADSFATGQALAKKLASKPGLRGVMLLSEGLNVNGSELVRGVNSVLDESIVVTGGLSGDGTRFKQTWVAIGGNLKSNVVAAVGFYGDYVQIGHGSKGGWDKFGPERVVTKSEGNVLYELDGKPALQLYKEYLGDKAKDLPSSGLLFPLALRSSNKDDKVLVRTLLAVDHEKNSLTFAGDIPKGYLAQLMKADFDRLIGGASLASAMAKDTGAPLGKDSLVVAISCVGRRLVLGDRTEEEVEAVLEALPKEQKAHITGFYSYGEISPYASGHCDLHNQTMTLTVFTESPTPLARRAAPAVRPAAATTSVRPPVPPPPAPARPSPMATGAHQIRSTPLEEIEADLNTSNTDTRQLPMNDGFGVGAVAYDLKSRAWSSAFPDLDSERTLVLAFGSPDILGAPDCMGQLARAYPKSVVLGCSSAGEIHGTQVKDESLSVTVSRFEKTGLQLASMDVASPGDSFVTGQMLAKKLGNRPGLRGVLILSEGLNVNGSELVRGVNSVLDDSIVVTGGLSGDGTRFKQTWVAVGPKVRGNVVAAVGFYGDYIQIGHGSKGGWDKFGPERVVTKSEGNVLYELDGKPALQLYKEYLGDKAKDLPSSGLLFPLSLRSSSKDDKILVRTLLAVDHEKNTLTFAGDIPKGYLAQLMKADFDRLIGGASLASAMATDNGNPVSKDALVVAISCVGRRLVLGDRTEEEVEAVLEAFPPQNRAQITGFYSYGEISPYASGHCDLHNQTMTLTVFTESKTPLQRRVGKPKTPPLPMSVQAPASGPMNTGVSATTPSMLVPSPAPPAARSPLASPPEAVSMSAPPPSLGSGQARAPGAPVTRIPVQASGATGAAVQKQRRGDVTLVTVTGRLTETFKGESVGRELRGTIAIDLGGVDRITSFGVREWLSMLGAMQEVRRFYFLRCSEAVVNQLGMIRKFAGTAQIVSFFAPYLCSSCGEAFERGFDCEREAEAIRAGKADPVACPHCAGEGRFDDDARSYFAFAAPHLNTPVPPEIRALQDELDAQAPPAPRDAVDKTVEGNVTRVRVQSKLGNNVRWKRVLDGIEGALVIDLGGVTGIEPAGLTNFEQAMNALGSEVSSIAIERCPAQLVERFAQAGTPRRVSVTSANLDAYCRSCAVHRTAHVSLQEHGDALAHHTPPRVNCKRCNGELELRGADLALNYLRSQIAGEPPPRPSPEVPMSLGGLALGRTPDSRPTDDVAAGAAPQVTTGALKGRSLGMPIAIGALSLTVLVLVFMQMSRATAPAAAAHPGATANAGATTPGVADGTPTKDTGAAGATVAPPQPVGWMQNVDLPPSWVERPFVLEGDNAYVVGKGELSPSPEAAIAQARNDAIVRLMKQVQQELAGTPMAEFLQARMRDADKNTSETIAERYMKQFGTTAAPERVDAALRKRDSSVEGFARYKLSKSAYQGIVNAYRETTTFQGMTIARFFPLLETTLHADGDLVVLSVQRGRPAAEQGVRAGDVVVSVAGRPVGSIDSLVKVSNDAWSSTSPRSTMSVDIESAGAKHTVRFFKPAPPNP